MRILITGYMCRPNGSSEGANAFHLPYEVARLGHTVTILTRPPELEFVLPGIRVGDPVPGDVNVEVVEDTLPRYLPVIRTGLSATYLRYCLWQKRAATWIKAHSAQFDIVQHVSWASISLPIGAAYSGLPFVVGPIGGGQIMDEELFRWIDGPAKAEHVRNLVVRSVTTRNPLARRASRESVALLAANEETRQLLMSKLGATAVTLMIPDGVKRESTGSSTNTYPTEKEIVWVGRFMPTKAAGLAVRAFRLALNEHPDAHMTMVGDGPARESVIKPVQIWSRQGALPSRARCLGQTGSLFCVERGSISSAASENPLVPKYLRPRHMESQPWH